MKKAIALATLISASSIGGVYAQDLAPTTPAPSPSDVTVVYITEATDSESSNDKIPPALMTPNPQAAEAAQEQIQTDSNLMAALEEKNVQLQNVAGIETAANGGKIVYVR
ncbi:hypothetical protein [Neorhizobium sp. T25_27]|uniref:hypothetical protein n=1 Tax=Neorhizobium sp. T25_27 TaxID=2093831 RepID=UPI000CF9C44D|nr:hypothetical protein [Neorhizobium sp. T25_27]